MCDADRSSWQVRPARVRAAVHGRVDASGERAFDPYAWGQRTQDSDERIPFGVRPTRVGTAVTESSLNTRGDGGGKRTGSCPPARHSHSRWDSGSRSAFRSRPTGGGLYKTVKTIEAGTTRTCGGSGRDLSVSFEEGYDPRAWGSGDIVKAPATPAVCAPRTWGQRVEVRVLDSVEIARLTHAGQRVSAAVAGGHTRVRPMHVGTAGATPDRDTAKHRSTGTRGGSGLR